MSFLALRPRTAGTRFAWGTKGILPRNKSLPASMSSIKRDVKKKNSASTGVEIVSQDPAHDSCTALEEFGLWSVLMSFSADGDGAVELERAASELVASEATMVLSEAHGLRLFLVIREGITCNG